MAGRKEYELIMNLKAALGGNFNSTFQTAINTTKKLQSSLTDIKKVQKDISGYKKTQDAITAQKDTVQHLASKHTHLQQELTATVAHEKELQKALERSKKATGTGTEEYKRLQSELKSTQTQKEKLTAQIKNNEAATDRASKKISEEEQKLASLSKELQTAGVNTNKLTQENDKLENAYNRVKKSQEEIARVNQAIDKNKASISATKTELTKTIGTVAAVGAAFTVPIKGAMEFESSMAEVSKVVDWIGNGNDATAEQIRQYNELGDELYGLTRQIPMTAKEFGEISAAAGQANVAMDNSGLIEFATDAAKMGIAFDTTAEQAGDWMAKWRTSFKMTQSEVVGLSDVINYLGNTTPATAAQISSVVTKIGPLGEVAGLASKDIAALGASIVGVGIEENVAATGIKNLMLDLTKGTATTEKMNGVLEKLGTSATDLANRMQTDATGAIMDFMRAVKQLPEAEQAAALNSYFGEQSVGAIAPLLSNLEFLEEQFYKVGDAEQYAGSMEAEYAARAATSENSFALLKNAVKELSDTFGKIFVPGAKDGAEALTQIVWKVTDFVKANPDLIKTVTKIAGGLAGLKIAGLGAKLGIQEITLGVKYAKKAFALFNGGLANTVAKAVTNTGKLSGLGKGISGYFGGIKSAMGGVGGSIGKIFSGGKMATAFSGVGNVISGSVLKSLSGVSGKITGIFGKVGGNIAKGPLGKIGSIIGKGIGNTASVFAPLTKLGGAIFAPLTGMLGPLLPVVTVITLIVTGFMLIKNNIEKIRAVIGNVFRDAGLAVFDKLVETITNIGDTVKNIFSDGNLAGVRQFIENTFGEQGLAVFNKFIAIIQTVGATFLEFCGFIDTTVRPLIESLFGYIVETVLPVIAAKFVEWAPTIQAIISGLGEAIQAIIEAVVTVIETVLPVIKTVFEDVFKVVGGVIDGFLTTMEGIVTFISGVFSGDIDKALNGVADIFDGVFKTIKEVVMGPINFMKDGITGLIDKIKSIGNTNVSSSTDSDGNVGIRVRGYATGGIITRPTLATFAEEGPEAAIPLDGSANAKALWLQAGKLLGMSIPQINVNKLAFSPQKKTNTSIPSVSVLSTSGGGTSVTIYNQPTIYIDGSKPNDLEEKLEQNNRNLLRLFEQRLKNLKRDEERLAYV